MSDTQKQIHLAAHFPGVNNTTVWSDPEAGSQIDFASFSHFARTAERARFDFLFLAEGLRLREQGGEIYDLDVVGRPDTFTVLAALAAVTDRIGLAGTINSTFNEPYEVARQFASLDHLSAGRAAWNVVTSWDAFTGENFRRGGFLAEADRYTRAEQFLRTAWELFDSWAPDEVVADPESGRFLRTPDAGTFAHRDQHFDIAGRFNVPRSPQGRPVIFQAGDSDQGREFAAATADAIFSRHSAPEAGRVFYQDVKGRLARHGRTPDELLILPAATFVLGDTDAEAAERAHEVRRSQVSGQTAIKFLEHVWNRDLSGYDPDGPLPDIDPDPGEHTVARGRASVRMVRDPLATASEWRQRAKAEGLSIRELVIETSARQTFIGSPATVAAAVNAAVQSEVSDGFILAPHLVPGGLDEFADTVVPLLQERGVFRTEYEGPTLRDHLGLRTPGV
ncbi:NtaA/DmoA family FMN-dependent monooxygenase [Streptomyces sp. NBC_01020]|uniref:NtaA/DmoA family FMN-dependent monooxygenase n=1 Tax=unclassified Streptomyces TaxID=2593676 RepID=UPI00386FD605|nr:NtaA/DmoA family FMN-dependent monooxygenase [Streptomyces sp. NBC_01020]WSX45919.1 NtaA/DmoA family FMN-dependent monooxygenase [Streptomyces sp. NBC_00963]WSX66003.1 NtaA/DmoA family FMN-dependent monooxygenase [Streptomyces sp. NBC_00932]